jgi:hypothetical protein
MCRECKKEAEALTMEIVVAEEDFTITARAMVKALIVNEYEDRELPAPKFKTRIVWFTKTLRNWKAIVISDLPDECLYEVIYDGEKRQTYIDTYEKTKQTVVRDGD